MSTGVLSENHTHAPMFGRESRSGNLYARNREFEPDVVQDDFRMTFSEGIGRELTPSVLCVHAESNIRYTPPAPLRISPSRHATHSNSASRRRRDGRSAGCASSARMM